MSVPVEQALREPMRSPMRLSAAARYYLTAFTVTNVGVGGFTLAIGLTLFSATGSAVTFGIAVTLEYALGVAGQIIGGSVLDRRNVLSVGIFCNALRAALVLTGGVLALVTHSPIPVVIVFLCSAVLRPIYRAASFALVATVCRRDERLRVNAIRFGLLQLAQLGGLGLVGALNAAVGAPGAIVGVAVAFVAGTLLLLPLRANMAARPPVDGPNGSTRGALIRTWRELARAIHSVPSVLIHLILGGVAPIVVSICVIFVAPVNAELHGGGLGIVLLDGSATVGALLAILIIRRLPLKRLPLALGSSIILSIVGLIGLAISPGLVVASSQFGVLGVAIGLGAAASDTLLQLRTASAIVGRIAISQEFAVSLLILLVLPLSGPLLAAQGFRATSLAYAAVVAIFLVVMICGLWWQRSLLFTCPITLPGTDKETKAS